MNPSYKKSKYDDDEDVKRNFNIFKQLCDDVRESGDCLELVFAAVFDFSDKKLFEFINNDPELKQILQNSLSNNNVLNFKVEFIGEYDPICYWSSEIEELIYLKMSVPQRKKLISTLASYT